MPVCNHCSQIVSCKTCNEHHQPVFSVPRERIQEIDACSDCEHHLKRLVQERTKDVSNLKKTVMCLKEQLIFLRKLDPKPGSLKFTGDVTFVVEAEGSPNEFVQAHQFVLDRKFPLFNSIFGPGTHEKLPATIHVYDTAAPVPPGMVNFCYTAEISYNIGVTPERITSFYGTPKFLGRLKMIQDADSAVPSWKPEYANAAAAATDGSAGISATKITSEISPLSPPSVDMGEEEYSGMPKVDADIEVGRKIVRRRKLSVACPPSSFYSDVKPPAMELVQRALRGLKTTIRPFRRQQPRNQATEFHDEQGHMLLYGCLNGKFIGDALGGLPHGRGQHWTPSRGCKSAPKYRHLLYEGAWEYGAKTGYGRMFYHNGQEYRGHFKEGQRHGRGAIRYLDGTVYDGEWFKGRRHGLGTSYYKDGGFYKGAWCKDNRDGWGAYYWPSKCRKYEGEWVGDDPVCGNHTRIEEWEYMALKELVPDWCNVKEYLSACLPKETLELPLMQLRNPECVYYPHACGRRQHRIDFKRAMLKDPPDPKIVPEHKGSLSPQQMQALRLAFDKLSPGYYRRTMVNKIQIRRMILLARLDPDSEMVCNFDMLIASRNYKHVKGMNLRKKVQFMKGEQVGRPFSACAFFEVNQCICKKYVLLRGGGHGLTKCPSIDPNLVLYCSSVREGKRLFVSLQEAAIPTAGLTYNNFMKTILHFHYPRGAMPYRQKDSPAKE